MPTTTLTGLPGTGGAPVYAVRFSHADSARGLLKHHRGVFASGPLGSVTVYRDDGGAFRCDRTYLSRAGASATVDTLDEVVAWLRINLPLMGKEAA